MPTSFALVNGAGGGSLGSGRARLRPKTLRAAMLKYGFSEVSAGRACWPKLNTSPAHSPAGTVHKRLISEPNTGGSGWLLVWRRILIAKAGPFATLTVT